MVGISFRLYAKFDECGFKTIRYSKISFSIRQIFSCGFSWPQRVGAPNRLEPSLVSEAVVKID